MTTSLQVVKPSAYARIKGAWDRRLPADEARAAWRRISGGSYLSPPSANSKLAKGQAKGWQTVSLSLAPADMSDFHVCPSCTDECRRACIGHTAGNARYPAVVDARIARTNFLFRHPEAAMGIIAYELERMATAKRMAVRWNTFSDIVHEAHNPGMLQYATDLGYRNYDYTKIAARLLRPFPNYDLTFSYSGYNWSDCKSILDSGGRVSMVFAGWFPKKFMGYPVVNGDAHDLRFLDPGSCIVGLKLKGVSPDTAGQFAVREGCILE